LVGLGYLGFLGMGVIGAGLSGATEKVEEIVAEIRSKAETVVYGKETYPTENIPANPEDWVNRDPETGERINPLNYGAFKHKFPGFSSLVGLGISWGETSWNWNINPFNYLFK